VTNAPTGSSSVGVAVFVELLEFIVFIEFVAFAAILPFPDSNYVVVFK
jgi:hypothetical protein